MTQIITDGAGYSFDTQQIAPQHCFNSKASPISNPQTDFRVTAAMSFADVQQELHKHMSAKGALGKFSGSVETHYLRFIQDKDYTLSLIYYMRMEGTVALPLTGVGLKALNEVGKDTYTENPSYFGITCGDHYLATYQKGALLIMGINVGFKSHYDKQTFESKISGGWGNIFSASRHIKEIFTNYKLAGSVSIHALQIGGDPVQIPKALSKDSKGNYHILQCSVEEMDKCTAAANGLLEYANQHFTKQASLNSGEGLVPLPGSFQYRPIEQVGLKAPASMVTPAVCRARAELEVALDANRYYFDKLSDLRFRYPVAWDEKSAAFFALKPLYERAEANLRALMDTDPYRGAIGCYSMPDKCLDIAKGVKGRLKEITAADLAPVSEVTRWCYEYTRAPAYPSAFIYSNGKEYKFDGSAKSISIGGTSTSGNIILSINITQSLGYLSFKTNHNGRLPTYLFFTYKYDLTDRGIGCFLIDTPQSNTECKACSRAGTMMKSNNSFHIAPYTSSIDLDLECGKPAGETSDDL